MAAFISKKSFKQCGYEVLPTEDAVEELEMVSSLLPQYENIVERPVRAGETLHTIAINYSIPVSELKRINRIQKDSEFFALSIIKIPVKANSVLSEILQDEADNCTTASVAVIPPRVGRLSSCTTNETEDSDGDSCVGYVSIHQILREKSTRREARRFLANMQADLARIKEKVVSDKASLEEAAAALTDPRFVPLPTPQSLQSRGSGGLSWWRLFIGAILTLLLLPIAYLIYMLNFE